MDKLKPCPFCGSDNIIVRVGNENDGWIGFTAITCMNQKNPFCVSQWVEKKKEHAIKSWNERYDG